MDDMWDDVSAPQASFSHSNNAPKAFSSGICVGRGRGFGNLADIKNALPKVGSSFNNIKVQSNTSDDNWDDAPKSAPQGHGNGSTWDNSGNSWQQQSSNNQSGGWGSDNNRNKFDSRSGNGGNSWQSNRNSNSSGWNEEGDTFGGRNKDRWSSSDQDGDSKGGFGNRPRRERFKGGITKGTSRNFTKDNRNRKEKGSGCFKCGEEGHMSRECPNAEKSSSRACYKCGEEGHMSRDCTNSSDRPKKGCFKCGGEGHMSRECPNSSSSDRPKGCFKCGEEGHMSRDCTNSSSSDRPKGCFKCGEEGHMSRDCTNSSSSDRPKGCFKCGEEGHMSRDCTNPSLGPDGKPRPAPYIPPELPEDEGSLFTLASTGINFSKYDSIPIEVGGKNAPKGIELFEEANFLPLITKNIKRSGYDKPTPIQKHAIPIILQGRDLMACAQTGSGKTAAFLLPIIQHMCSSPDLPNLANQETQEPWAVIVSPTRELAIQIHQEAKKFSYDSIVRTEVVYGGTSVGYQSGRIKKGCHILVATPGRLLDFVEKGKVSFAQLKYLILDEADRMLDMGFMPCIRKMVDDPNMPPKDKRNTLMFSATFPQEIQTLAKDFLCDYLFLSVGVVGAANTDVEQTLFSVGQYDKRKKLMEILNESGTDRTLVFVEQKRTADFIASYTSQNNIPTTSIHGDRLQREREEALMDFRSGKMPVLVATAVAARGLDIKDVRHVINYDLPSSIDEYVHRIGRTGRVGNLGKATSFYDPGVDQPLARSLKKILIDAQQPIPEWLSDEANQAIGTAPQFGGRSNFGSRDMRSKGRSGDQDSSNSWDNNFASADSGGFGNEMSHPVAVEDSWD